MQNEFRKSRAGFSKLELTLMATLALCFMILIPCYILKSRYQSRRVETRNNLKQIGIAIQNYEDTFGQMPPVLTDLDDQLGE